MKSESPEPYQICYLCKKEKEINISLAQNDDTWLHFCTECIIKLIDKKILEVKR